MFLRPVLPCLIFLVASASAYAETVYVPEHGLRFVHPTDSKVTVFMYNTEAGYVIRAEASGRVAGSDQARPEVWHGGVQIRFSSAAGADKRGAARKLFLSSLPAGTEVTPTDADMPLHQMVDDERVPLLPVAAVNQTIERDGRPDEYEVRRVYEVGDAMLLVRIYSRGQAPAECPALMRVLGAFELVAPAAIEPAELDGTDAQAAETQTETAP
ncbi:MAG: hypothetical protein ACOCVS_02730 [Planctomycetota bacterium]